MPKEAERALLEFRAKHRVIGSALVFPMKNDPNRAVRQHLAADWLKRAYRYAEIERPKGGLWHPFRRKFATERKFYPLRDVADAGGWKDVGTLLKCYQLSDEETIRTVMDNPKPLRRPDGGRQFLNGSLRGVLPGSFGGSCGRSHFLRHFLGVSSGIPYGVSVVSQFDWIAVRGVSLWAMR